MITFCQRQRLAPRQEKELAMRKHDSIMLALSVAILAIVLAISPNVETAADETWTAIHGADILDFTKNSGELPELNFIAY